MIDFHIHGINALFFRAAFGPETTIDRTTPLVDGLLVMLDFCLVFSHSKMPIGFVLLQQLFLRVHRQPLFGLLQLLAKIEESSLERSVSQPHESVFDGYRLLLEAVDNPVLISVDVFQKRLHGGELRHVLGFAGLHFFQSGIQPLFLLAIFDHFIQHILVQRLDAVIKPCSQESRYPLFVLLGCFEWLRIFTTYIHTRVRARVRAGVYPRVCSE
mmetsp:Transcript_112453/g.210915  ORF Transcript_112453/g.210915 Transcript_112453/m.210915 type:complete len:214 (+) Transcript_112453:912-1553(+)